MCRLSDAELYCVRTNVRSTSELIQFDSAISTSLYFPPNGTAGFDLCCVSGNSRFPAPPPRIIANNFELGGIVLEPISNFRFKISDLVFGLRLLVFDRQHR